MESFLKLYFGNALGRSRLIATVVYVIAMTVIVTSILGWFGLRYSNPKEITIASIFSFVLSGQVLYPLAGVVIYYFVADAFVSFINNPLYQRYKFYIFRDMNDLDMCRKVERELMDRRFINWEWMQDFKKGPLQKGSQFHQFEEFLKKMFWEDFTIVSSWKLMSNAAFAVMLSMGFHLNAGAIVVTAFVLAVIAWLFFTLVYWAVQRQAEYREIYEQFYFKLLNPTPVTEIVAVSTWNRHFKKFERWEFRKRAKKRLKKMREKKLLIAA